MPVRYSTQHTGTLIQTSPCQTALSNVRSATVFQRRHAAGHHEVTIMVGRLFHIYLRIQLKHGRFYNTLHWLVLVHKQLSDLRNEDGDDSNGIQKAMPKA